MKIERHWVIAETDPEAVLSISEALGISRHMAKFLIRRGYGSAAEASAFVAADFDQLENPFRIVDMEKAVDRLRTSARSNEHVFVAGDRDTDGVTSTTLLVDLLKFANVSHSWKVPSPSDGYGLSRSAVDAAKERGAGLIIAVDCGIRDHDGVRYAREKDIDVVILDHHEPGEDLPDAVAVVDMKRSDCDCDFCELSACGIAFKFAQAYLMAEDPSFYKKDFVIFDLETTGTDREQSEILEIGAIKARNGVELDRFHTLVKPSHSIPGDKTDIHGITNEMVAGAPSIRAAVSDFLEFAGPATFVVHNAGFDVTILKNAARRALDRYVKNEVFDTLAIAREEYPGEDSSLGGLAQKFDLTHENAHRAMSDVEATFGLFKRLTARRNKRSQAFLKTHLDLVALSTIADVVPLVRENRVLVKRGLDAIRKSKRPGVVALRSELIRGEGISSKDISWSVTPVINAAGRMGRAHVAVSLLLAENADDARRFLAELVAMNTERKERVKTNMEVVDDALERDFNPDADAVAVVAVKGIEHGVTGLLANRVMHAIGRPAVILIEDDDGVARGTGRSIDGFDLAAAYGKLSGIIEKFGGHSGAAGVSIPLHNVPEFRRRLDLLVREAVPADLLRPRIEVDAEVEPGEINDSLVKELELVEPTGHGNPAPIFCCRNVQVVDSMRMGNAKQHLKLRLESGAKPLELLAWNRPGGDEPKAGDRIDVAFGVERSEWKGRVAIQCMIEDIRRVTDHG